MNLWHQRIIIFLAKVFGVISGLLILGYFLYYNVYFKTDALIKYVPQNAVLYSTFRLTPDLEQNQLIQKIKARLLPAYNLSFIDFKSLTQLAGNNFSLALVFKDNQLNTLLVFDLGLDKSKADKFLNAAKEGKWQAQIYSNEIKSHNILVLSNSSEVLNEVGQVVAKKTPALSQRIDLVLKLKQFVPEVYFGKVFIDTNYFSNLAASGNAQMKALANQVKADLPSEIFAGCEIQDYDLVIQNQANESLKYNLRDLAANLPADSAYALSFTDLSGQWQKAMDNLKQTDQQYFQTLKNNLEYYQNVYNFNFQTDILPIIGNQDQLVITKDNQYLLSTSLDNQDIQSQTDKIEKLFKTYIATQYPSTKSRVLPDGSKITTIEREPAKFSFKADKLADLQIKYINWANQEFIYILSNNNLILANSRQIIAQILNNDPKIADWQAHDNLLNFPNYSDNLFINWENATLPWDLKGAIKYSIISFDPFTKKIRLILE